jgi:hypothetical protein
VGKGGEGLLRVLRKAAGAGSSAGGFVIECMAGRWRVCERLGRFRQGRNPGGVGNLLGWWTQGRPAVQANPGLGDAIPLGLWICWGGGPRVGHRASGQPWAGGRNPVGIVGVPVCPVGLHVETLGLGVTGRMPVPQGRPAVQANPGLGDAIPLGLGGLADGAALRRRQGRDGLLSNSFASCSLSTSWKPMAAACFSKMARSAPERKVKLLPPPHRHPVLRLLRGLAAESC